MGYAHKKRKQSRRILALLREVRREFRRSGISVEQFRSEIATISAEQVSLSSAYNWLDPRLAHPGLRAEIALSMIDWIEKSKNKKLMRIKTTK